MIRLRVLWFHATSAGCVASAVVKQSLWILTDRPTFDTLFTNFPHESSGSIVEIHSIIAWQLRICFHLFKQVNISVCKFRSILELNFSSIQVLLSKSSLTLLKYFKDKMLNYIELVRDALTAAILLYGMRAFLRWLMGINVVVKQTSKKKTKWKLLLILVSFDIGKKCF